MDVSTWNSAINPGKSTLVRVSVRMPMKAMIPVDRMARIRLMEMFSSSCVAVLLFRAMDCDMDLRPFPAFPFLARLC